MEPAATVLLVVVWLLALGWLYQAIAALRGLPTLPDLTQLSPACLSPPPSTEGPQLTVIVPACNEQETIRECLRSLLGSTGVRLEILAVNDRSTDRTGTWMHEVAAEAAATSHTLRVLEIAELPAGWLGKPHAMAKAAEQATSEWLLFTDGDVIFAPEALALALRHAVAEQSGHLVLVPTLVSHSWREQAQQAAMQVLAQWSLRLWKVADAKARDFIGVGGFNLMRREAYEHVGGFESLRLEVLDDMRMGWKLKRAGYRSCVALGPDLVRIRWIVGARSVIKLIEKNGFAAFRFQPILHLLACFAVTLQAVVPLAALAAGFCPVAHAGWIAAGGATAYLGIALTYWANRRVTLAPVWVAALWSPCMLLLVYALVRSMTLALWRAGVEWRGTRYPLADLKKQSGRW